MTRKKERWRPLPVVGAVGELAGRGVHMVPDQPIEARLREESDLLPVGTRHVGTAGVEVPQEHHVLHTHTHTLQYTNMLQVET